MTGHEPWAELAVGHALGALEPEDEQEFTGHLRECAQCGRTLADMEAVAAQLAYGVDAAEPPPSLLDSIMTEVRASGRVAVVPRQAARVSPPRPRPSRGWPQPSWLATAAALALVVALTGWNLQLRADNAAKSRALDVRNKVGQLALDPQTRTVALKSDGAPRAEVFVQGSRAWLLVDGFDENDTSRQVYVLWKASDNALTPIHTFDVVHPGANFIEVGDVGDPTKIQSFAVSIEPGRTMPPTPSTVVVKA